MGIQLPKLKSSAAVRKIIQLMLSLAPMALPGGSRSRCSATPIASKDVGRSAIHRHSPIQVIPACRDKAAVQWAGESRSAPD